MIRLVTNSQQLDFLPNDAFSARITAYFDTYGTDYDFAVFWVQDGETAAVSKIDTVLTLFASENADFDEIKSFLNIVGYSEMMCELNIAQRLGLPVSDTSYIVEYKHHRNVDGQGILTDYDKHEIYNLLCDCGFSMGRYGDFLADICGRLNKSTASLSVIADSDGLCSCAFNLFNGRKSSLLGAVATKTDKRGKGFAGKLVSLLAENSGKRTFLFCRNDSLAGFYKKYGFEICGRWSAVKFEEE